MGAIRQLQPAAFPPPTMEDDAAVDVVREDTTSDPHNSLNVSSSSPTSSLSSTSMDYDLGPSAMSSSSSASLTHTQHTQHSPPYTLQLAAALRIAALAVVMVILSSLWTARANPVFVDNPGLAQFQSGRNIRHLPCIVRKSGSAGICMFAIDCIKQNGTHLGTCIDRFYFGSCCQLKQDDTTLYTPEISDNSIDQNTISHSAHHDSTTLPTSDLFKITAEPLVHVHSSSQRVPLRNTTTPQHPQNHSPLTGAGGKPVKNHTSTSSSTAGSRRPPAHTTPRISQFVVRTRPTTSRPLNTVPPTTVKPPRRRTTTTPATTATATTTRATTRTTTRRTTTTTTTTTAPPPVLTTEETRAPLLEERIETTTVQPPKFVTFQIVETTTPSATDATNIDEAPAATTTHRIPPTVTRRPKPPTTVGSQPTRPKLPATTLPAAITTRSPRPQPPTTRKPAATTTPGTTQQKPTHTRRPTPAAQKPLLTTTGQRVRPSSVNNTFPTGSASTTFNHRPGSTLITSTNKIDSFSTTPDESYTTTTLTTRAPRPKPTAEIVRVPPSTVMDSFSSPSKPAAATTLTSSSSSAGTKRPTTPGQTSSRPRPTKPLSTSSSSGQTRPTTPAATTIMSTTTTTTTSTTPATTTTTRTTTKKPPTTTAAPPPRITTSTTTTTTSTPLLSEEDTKSEEVPLTTASSKPGLVTWSDMEAEPVTNMTLSSSSSSSEEWEQQPRPPGEDWVPMPTITPVTSNRTPASAETSQSEELESLENLSSAPPLSSSTERIVISVSTSVSEIMSNGTVIEHKPSTSTTLGAASTKPSRPRPTSRPTITTITTTTTTTTAPPPPAPTTTSPKNITTHGATPSRPIITTEAPTPTRTPPAKTTTSTTSSTTTTTTTTEPPMPALTTEEPPTMEWNATNTMEMSTEDNFGTGSSTADYSTDDYNATMDMSTTTVPPNTLEGMDYREICGRRMFPEPRIVGGSNAAFGRWPWQISLRQWRTSTYLHKCGAALLNENWAITAAHCVDSVPPSDLLLRLGEYDLAEEEEPYGYQERRVQIVASHPQFDPRTFEYDLALLRFYEPVVFQPNIIPVCVPNNDVDFIGQTAFVTGWGRLYEDGPLPSVLQEVAVPVINNTICETMYRSAGYIEHIPHIFICAGWKKGGYDSCEGDSGGPMVLQREDDKRFQLGGVISWGIGCAEANQPGVYTRISEFRDWINQILQF